MDFVSAWKCSSPIPIPLPELQHRAQGQWQEDFVTHQESWGWASAATLGRDAQH